jgi:hypothetical protein
MQQRWRKYYAKEKMPVGEEYTFEKEFEVWARMIKDDEGNDIQIFKKIDEKNRFRKDSSFYYNGYWEVFEMKGETEITLRNSLGITTSSIRDREGKLQESNLVDKNGDIIINDKYIWNDDLLAKVISLEGTRVYYYGKNPYEDTVRVIPSDKGYLFHKGYDGTVGMIPKKGDADYESFLASPYGIRSELNDKKESGFNVLTKSGYNFVTVLASEKPDIVYINIPWSDTLKSECRTRCLPTDHNGKQYNGRVNLNPITTEEKCICKDNGWEISYKISLQKPTIELLQSFIVLDLESAMRGEGKKWNRMCLTEREIQDTYNHEVKHLTNAQRKIQKLIEEHIPEDKYKSSEKCKEAIGKAKKIIDFQWGEWLKNEIEHGNDESPTYTGLKQGVKCD